MTKAEKRESSLRKQWGDKAYEYISTLTVDEYIEHVRNAIKAGKGAKHLRKYFEELADKEVKV